MTEEESKMCESLVKNNVDELLEEVLNVGCNIRYCGCVWGSEYCLQSSKSCVFHKLRKLVGKTNQWKEQNSPPADWTKIARLW